MTTETILTDEQIEHGRHNTFSTNNPFCPCDSKTMRKAARWAERAVLHSPEIQALRKDAGRMRRDTLLFVLGKLNSNPYNLTKSECIDVIREMFKEADAATEQEK